MTEFLHKSLKDLATALRAGKTTSLELADAALDRQERFAETLGAYKSRNPEATRARARAADAALASGDDRGPLHGLPVSAKDLYGVAGFPTFAGTPLELPPEFVREGPLVAGLSAQHAVFVGKTHTVEIAFGGIGRNPHWGTPRNPWDAGAHRVPGGSSAGAGVSLNEGSAVLALGTDTAGSVRIPASVTGVFGLKTTWGRWSLDGIFPLSPSLDTPGILTRTAADAAFAFDAMDAAGGAQAAAQGAGLAGLRIGLPARFAFEDCAPGVAEGVRSALAALEAAGARLCDVELPEADEAHDFFVKGGLAACEAYSFLKDELPQVLDGLEPNVAQRMSEASELPAHVYIQRRRRLGRLAAAAAAHFDGIDLLAMPTVPITPPTLDEVAAAEDYRAANMAILRNTWMVNFLGLCAVTMPVALDEAGLPVGLQLVARANDEARLLGLACAAEAVLGNARDRLGVAPLCPD